MTESFSADAERRIKRILDKVPGYRGYRATEDRRDADRRIRDHLVAEYGAEADRVERVARDLATQRRLSDIGPVDEFAQALRHFIDRVRTATYGYAGLFGSRDANAAAIAQIQQFDESLLSGVDELNVPITNLETAYANNGDLAAPARAGAAVVRTLLARFDLRDGVIQTAKPAPEASVLAVLQPPQPAVLPPAYDLHQGDAVSILGDDYVVDARLDIAADDKSFRLFRLNAQPARWLYVPRQSGQSFALVSPTDAAYKPGPETKTTIGDATYTVQLAGSGEGDLVGSGGSSGRRPVRFSLLKSTTNAQVRAVVIDWSNERQMLVGKEVHPDDVEVYQRSR